MRLTIQSLSVWTWLKFDVVVSVRRQTIDEILSDELSVDSLENLELSLQANSTDALLNMDAVEVCGEPLQEHLDHFESDCTEGNGGNLRLITASVGQSDGPYRLPKNRLYVCNPNSRLKGAIFKDGELPKAIKTQRELENTTKTLFAGNLFEWQTSFKRKKGQRRSGKSVHGKPNRVYLWVLDMNGNWITGPEVQKDGDKVLLLKHGDYTPGEYPWKRPKASLLQDSEDSLLEGEAVKQDGFTETDEELQALAAEMEEEWFRRKKDKKDKGSTLGGGGVPTEQRMGGSYRGLARAGGEIRFYPEMGAGSNYALIEDSSSYACCRVTAAGLDPGRSMALRDVKKHLKKAEKHSTMGTCAMKRLKDYLHGPVGLSLSGAKVAAVFFKGGRHYEFV